MARRRCTHPKIRIIEEGTAYTTHHRDMDGSWVHDSDTGAYTGIVEVYCPHCGLHRRYGARKPRWLQRHIDEYTVP